MSPLVAYHATRRACRESIQKRGLLGSQPTKLQPWGVYVFTEGDDFDHPTWRTNHRLRWTHRPPQDLWRVAYIGPLGVDVFMSNGLVLYESVTHVTLVTGNSGD